MKVLLMYEPSAGHLSNLEAAAPGAQFAVALDQEAGRELIADAEVVLGNRFFLQSLPWARSLCWMQSNSVGVDRILAAADNLNGITLTSARGVYDDEIADHALALLLALCRDLHHFRDQQREREWKPASLLLLKGKRALMLGWGGVGRAVTARLRAFGVEVAAVRRRHCQDPVRLEGGLTLMGPPHWRSRLAESDFLIMALPLTPLTSSLVGRAELASLKPGAVVVNVGRGETLDTTALLEALSAGRLGGSGLDVVGEANEPLPADSPVWRESRILLTPHVARSRERAPFRWEPLFVENLARYHSGRPLLNVVDPEAGY